MNKPVKVNLGCGRFPLEGFINIDRYPGKGVDIVLDIEKPLPFESDSVDEVVATHVLEHLVRWEDLVDECWRVLKVGGKMTIKVPYGPDYSLGHIRVFVPTTLNGYFQDKQDSAQGVYTGKFFKCLHFDKKYQIPYKYHINKYLLRPLGLKDVPRYTRFGFKRCGQLTWILEKLPEVKEGDANDNSK